MNPPPSSLSRSVILDNMNLDLFHDSILHAGPCQEVGKVNLLSPPDSALDAMLFDPNFNINDFITYALPSPSLDWLKSPQRLEPEHGISHVVPHASGASFQSVGGTTNGSVALSQDNMSPPMPPPPDRVQDHSPQSDSTSASSGVYTPPAPTNSASDSRGNGTMSLSDAKIATTHNPLAHQNLAAARSSPCATFNPYNDPARLFPCYDTFFQAFGTRVPGADVPQQSNQWNHTSGEHPTPSEFLNMIAQYYPTPRADGYVFPPPYANTMPQFAYGPPPYYPEAGPFMPNLDPSSQSGCAGPSASPASHLQKTRGARRRVKNATSASKPPPKAVRPMLRTRRGRSTTAEPSVRFQYSCTSGVLCDTKFECRWGNCTYSISLGDGQDVTLPTQTPSAVVPGYALFPLTLISQDERQLLEHKFQYLVFLHLRGHVDNHSATTSSGASADRPSRYCEWRECPEKYPLGGPREVDRHFKTHIAWFWFCDKCGGRYSRPDAHHCTKMTRGR